MLTIAVWNLKGGTGKSTTTLNLGAALARCKQRVLLIDLDGQRTLSFGLGLDGKEPTALNWLADKKVAPIETAIKNLHLIPGDIGMFRLQASSDLFTPSLKGIKRLDYNIVLLDCPPNLGVTSVQAVVAAERVLVPTICQPAALKGLSEAIALIRDDAPDKPIDVLRSQYKRNLVLTREADDLLVEMAEDLDYRLLYTTIPDNISVAEAIAQQEPVLDYAPGAAGSQAFKSLAKEVSKIWGLKK